LQTLGDIRVSTHKLRPGDVDRLLELIERSRLREEQRIGGPVEVQSCYEAGYDGLWLHRRLRAAGVRNVVVEPTSLLIDAGTLLLALVADARGDWGVWRLVRLPTPVQEEAKRLHPLRAGCRERLDALVTGDRRPLGAVLRQDILREYERLEMVVSQLAAVKAERDAVAAGDATIGRG
jgi:transposase